MSEWYRVNVAEDDVEIIHNEPPTPQCDTTHMLEDISVDLPTVERLIKEGKARYCRHCFPDR